MSGDVYERLATALDGLANGFPRTESNVELRILRHVFTPDEAEVAAALTGRPPRPPKSLGGPLSSLPASRRRSRVSRSAA